MGRGDNRKTLKMRRRNARRKFHARRQKRIEAGKKA